MMEAEHANAVVEAEACVQSSVHVEQRDEAESSPAFVFLMC